MASRQIVPRVYEVSLGFVNAFLIDADGLTLIDTGVAGSTGKILGAVRALGRQPQDIRHILVTHCHADHTGSLSELKAATGAPAYMHPVDAEMVRAGRATRPMRPGPGIFNHLLFRLFMARRRAAPTTIQPTSIEREVQDGEELPIAGGIRAIHTPGHTAGHLSFYWPHQGGVLFVGDAAAHMFGLGYAPFYEDIQQGQQSLARLAGRDFAVACFGHGKALIGGAAARFRRKWPVAARAAVKA